MQDTTTRTFICSVAFVDLVGYSKKSVADQIQIKERFNIALSEAIKDTPVADRIVLDTGDGAALSFLGDPEDALFVTLNLRDQYHRLGSEFPDDAIRMGINLGPVKLVKDINGQPNIIGDGINVAQRIMSFSRPSQVIVSRSYYDAVSRISDDYAKLFHFEGSKTDKHVREHEVYLVGDNEPAISRIRAGAQDRALSSTQPLRTLGAGSDNEAPAAARGSSLALKVTAGFALAAVLLLGGLVWHKMSKPVPPPAIAERPKQLVIEAPKVEPKADEKAALSTDAKADPGKPADPAKPADPVKPPEPAKPGDVKTDIKPADGKAEVKPGEVKGPDGKAIDPKTAKTEPKPDPKNVGTVLLNIRPWGKVFVNGRERGTSPPVKDLKLPPGKYKIEVKNAENFPVHVENIELKAGDTLRLRHEFK